MTEHWLEPEDPVLGTSTQAIAEKVPFAVRSVHVTFPVGTTGDELVSVTVAVNVMVPPSATAAGFGETAMVATS